MKHDPRIALMAALVAATAFAQPVPERVSFTGNLANSGGPVSGMHNFVFTLYDAPMGGNVAWTETQNNLPVTNGLVYASLGAVTSLNATVLNGAPLYLEVTVSGATLSPRVAIQSVPYAIRAGTANSASTIAGLLPSELQRRVNGACTGANAVQAIDADGGVTCVSIAGGTGDITSVNTAMGGGLTGGVTMGDANLALVTCGNGESLKSNGTSWSCQPNPAISGTAPVAVAAGAVSLTNCGANQVYKMNAGGTAWVCSTDLNTTYTGAAPISVGGTTVSLTNCGANQVYKMNAGGTAWACAADNDTAPTASPPIAVSSNNISLTACAPGQIYKVTASGAWACAPDNDTTYTGSTPIAVSSGNAISLATCPANQVLKMNAAGNAWACSSATSVVTASTTAQFSVTSDTMTWLFGVTNITMSGDTALLTVNFDFVMANTTGGAACGALPQCSFAAGWLRPCYRAGASSPLVTGPYHYFYDPAPNSSNRRAAQVVVASFAGLVGSYDFGICAHKNGVSTQNVDFVVDNPNVVLQRL